MKRTWMIATLAAASITATALPAVAADGWHGWRGGPSFGFGVTVGAPAYGYGVYASDWGYPAGYAYSYSQPAYGYSYPA